jgi:hypothetical protein
VVNDMTRKLWNEVFEEEKAVIRKWREIREKPSQQVDSDHLKSNATVIENHGVSAGDETNTSNEIRDLVGLAFSGGGIRSATFGLGVLEALKDKGLLTKIDYLSTVSGGGYIGSWLSANCRRQGKEWLEQEAYDPNQNLVQGKSWKASIVHLRRFSNYLSPELSFLSADTWTIVTTWLRNTILIQLIIVLALGFVLFVPRLMLLIFEISPDSLLQSYCYLLVLAIIIYGFVIYKIDFQVSIKSELYKDGEFSKEQKTFRCVVLLLFLASFCFSILLWTQAHHDQLKVLMGYVILNKFIDPVNDLGSFSGCLKIVALVDIPLLVVFYAAFVKFSRYSTKQNKLKLVLDWVIAPLPATFVLAALLAVELLILSGWAGLESSLDQSKGISLAYVWAPTMTIANISFAINIMIGMLGRDSYEHVREWWSRFAAWLAIIGFAWMVIVIVAIYGPLWIAWLFYDGSWKTLGSGWFVTTLAGLMAGRSSDTGGSSEQQGNVQSFKEIIAKFAPFVFIAGLFIAVSMVVHLLIAFNSYQPQKSEKKEFSIARENLLVANDQYADKNWGLKVNPAAEVLANAADKASVTVSPNAYEDKPLVYSAHWQRLTETKFVFTFLAFLSTGFAVLFLSWRIDINEFSFNAFYRNRLARCYLGAARPPADRKPHPFTGFDANDDLKLSDLLTNNDKPGPFHIINCALNLGGSHDLTLHTRHSAIFTLTPLYCGSSYEIKSQNFSEKVEMGYIDTQSYTGTEEPTLAQAFSVSGAAASPNMGYHTSPSVAFLLTLFNVRLGWWYPHPLKSRLRKPSPGTSLNYLLYELFGVADETSDFLNISDGGHFENLAAYELVRRKCKVIIISDGECDPKLQFEGLSNLIRLCEVDRLAKIEIDVSAVKFDGPSAWSNSCCAVGRIKYSAFPTENKQAPDGWLIYIKAAMTGHEDTAIMQYKATHPDFPHETTGDQFYAEDQFESYRLLGKNITSELFGKWDKKAEIMPNPDPKNASSVVEMSMADIAHGLSHILSPELVHQTQSIVHADRLIDIWKQLSENEKLIEAFNMNLDLSKRIQSSELIVAEKDSGTTSFQPIFYFCSEIIQLMENVYLDLNLEETWDRDDNKGWMALFRLWASTPQVMQTWQLTSHTYGIKFISFWERKLNNQS